MTDATELLVARIATEPRLRAILRTQPRRVLRGRGLSREQVQRVLRALEAAAERERTALVGTSRW